MVNNQAGLPPFEGTIPGVTIPFIGTLAGDSAALQAADGAIVTVDATVISNPTFGLIGRSASGPCALLICQTSWKTRAGSGVVPLFWAKNFRSDAPSIAVR